MKSSLASLALRRALPAGFIASATVVAALVVASQRVPQIGGGIGLVRENVWTVLVVALAPFVLHRGAAIVGRWREGEIDWLAKVPVSRARMIAESWLGALGAAALVVAFIAFAAELATPPAHLCERRIGIGATPANAALDSDSVVSWNADAPPQARRARIYLAYIPTVSSAEIELVARGDESRSSRLRISANTSMEVDLPPRREPRVEFELRRLGAGGIVIIERPRIDWLVESTEPRLASALLGAHVLIALGAWLALALGLGAWMRGSIATAATLALSLPVWFVDGELARALLPGATLADALELVGRGVIPDTPSALSVASAGCVAALGLALAIGGTRRWRLPT